MLLRQLLSYTAGHQRSQSRGPKWTSRRVKEGSGVRKDMAIIGRTNRVVRVQTARQFRTPVPPVLDHRRGRQLVRRCNFKGCAPGFRRGTLLRKYMYEFAQLLAPHLERRLVDRPPGARRAA